MRVDKKLNLCGMLAPYCLMVCKATLAAMPSGAVLEVQIRDPDTIQDLVTILERTGETLLARTEHRDHTCLRIMKKETIMANVELTTISAASVVDARGSACPGPLLEAKKGIGKVKVGEVLEVLSNDSNTKNDIPIWAKKVGHEYLGHVSEAGYDRLFIIRRK